VGLATVGGVVAMRTSRVAVPSHMPLTEDVDGTGMGGRDWTLSGRRPAVWTASGSSEACYPPAVRAEASAGTAWCQDFESELGRRPGRGPLAG
jgi:hypothetical protein